LKKRDNQPNQQTRRTTVQQQKISYRSTLVVALCQGGFFWGSVVCWVFKSLLALFLSHAGVDLLYLVHIVEIFWGSKGVKIVHRMQKLYEFSLKIDNDSDFSDWLFFGQFVSRL